MTRPTAPSPAAANADIVVLANDASRYAKLTFPSFASRLADLQPPFVAVGARTTSAVAGLALGWLTQDGGAEVLSVSVRHDLRRQGLAAALLAALEKALANRGANRVLARYADALPSQAAIAALLERSAWSTPEPYSVQVTGLAGAMADEGGAWAGVAGRLKTPRDFSFPALVMSDDDDDDIERLMQQPNWGSHLDPRQFRRSLDPDCSLAIRRGEALVGWVIGERRNQGLGPGTSNPGGQSVYYPENYLDETLWSAGLSIGAYFHAFSRQAARYGPQSRAIYRTHPGAARMLAFTRRRFASMAERVDTVLISRKTLGAG